MATQVIPNHLNFQMFSVREIPKELRVRFELPSYPYADGGRGDSGIAYLQELGVFFFRDELHGEAITINIPDGGIPMIERSGFRGFKVAGLMHEATMAVGSWPLPKTAKERQKQAKYLEKWGDLNAWLFWNQVGTVVNFNEGQITFV